MNMQTKERIRCRIALPVVIAAALTVAALSTGSTVFLAGALLVWMLLLTGFLGVWWAARTLTITSLLTDTTVQRGEDVALEIGVKYGGFIPIAPPSVEVKEFKVTQDLTDKEKIDKALVLDILRPLDEGENYTKHYFQKDGRMKVFLKGGSSLVVDTQTGDAVYERLERRFLLSDMVKLSSVHWITSWKLTKMPLLGQ